MINGYLREAEQLIEKRACLEIAQVLEVYDCVAALFVALNGSRVDTSCPEMIAWLDACEKLVVSSTERDFTKRMSCRHSQSVRIGPMEKRCKQCGIFLRDPVRLSKKQEKALDQLIQALRAVLVQHEMESPDASGLAGLSRNYLMRDVEESL